MTRKWIQTGPISDVKMLLEIYERQINEGTFQHPSWIIPLMRKRVRGEHVPPMDEQLSTLGPPPNTEDVHSDQMGHGN